MTAVLLQSNHANVGAGATTLQCQFSQQVCTPGSLLIVYAGSTAAGRTFTASDNANGAYNVDISPGQSQAILSFPFNTSSGNPTVTLTISGAATEITMIIEEWSGIQTVTPLDKTASTTTGSATTATAGTTATLSQTNELCVAMLHLNGNSGSSFAVASPFTAGPSSPWPALNNSLLANGYLLQASTAAVTATFNWVTATASKGCTATYKTIPAGIQAPPLYNRRSVLYFT